jgi:hypothetical protein
MRVTHYARPSFASALLSLALAGCGKDSGPSAFDPQGTAADMTAAQSAFSSPQTASFAAIGYDISVVLNGSPVVASSAALALSAPSSASARYARRLAALVPAGGRGIQATAASIPSDLLGTTYVWDETTDVYVASDLPGAPASGVRFILYAVDPVLRRPVEPIVEVGYVDVIDKGSASLTDLQVKVVEGNYVYLDYEIVASATASSGLVTITGFADNGTTRATFNLKNTISQNGTGIVVSLDYALAVPSRHLSLDWTATFANISETDVAVTLDLVINGPNGNVRLVGTYGSDGGAFTVKVNGDLFATVTLTGGTPSITGAGGEPLTPDEEATLETILDYYEASLGAFSELLTPVS